MWRSRQAAQDGVERIPRDLRLDPAQHVVGAKLDDDGIGALRHRPIEPGEPVGGGIAGDAGIGDLGRDALGRERRLQARHEAVLVGQAVSGGQRIAERDDIDRRLRRCAGRHGCSGDERRATNRRTGDLDQSAPPPI